MTYYIVVNKNRVKSNRKHGTDDPVFRVSKGKYGKPFYRKSIGFFQAVFLIEDKENPLPCGATVWMETLQEIVPEAL